MAKKGSRGVEAAVSAKYPTPVVSGPARKTDWGFYWQQVAVGILIFIMLAVRTLSSPTR